MGLGLGVRVRDALALGDVAAAEHDRRGVEGGELVCEREADAVARAGDHDDRTGKARAFGRSVHLVRVRVRVRVRARDRERAGVRARARARAALLPDLLVELPVATQLIVS